MPPTTPMDVQQMATIVTLLCMYQHLTLAGPHQLAPQTTLGIKVVVGG